MVGRDSRRMCVLAGSASVVVDDEVFALACVMTGLTLLAVGAVASAASAGQWSLEGMLAPSVLSLDGRLPNVPCASSTASAAALTAQGQAMVRSGRRRWSVDQVGTAELRLIVKNPSALSCPSAPTCTAVSSRESDSGQVCRTSRGRFGDASGECLMYPAVAARWNGKRWLFSTLQRRRNRPSGRHLPFQRNR